MPSTKTAAQTLERYPELKWIDRPGRHKVITGRNLGADLEEHALWLLRAYADAMVQRAQEDGYDLASEDCERMATIAGIEALRQRYDLGDLEGAALELYREAERQADEEDRRMTLDTGREMISKLEGTKTVIIAGSQRAGHNKRLVCILRAGLVALEGATGGAA